MGETLLESGTQRASSWNGQTTQGLADCNAGVLRFLKLAQEIKRRKEEFTNNRVLVQVVPLTSAAVLARPLSALLASHYYSHALHCIGRC